MDAVVFLLLVGLVLFGLDRLARWAERRGWIYYSVKKRGSTLGAVMSALDPIYHPSSHHVAAEQRRSAEDRDDEEDGAPPEMP